MLNAKDFKAEAVDEIIATAEIWGQETTVILSVELDEDEDNEACYIKRAMEFVEHNIDLINESLEMIEAEREEILEQLIAESPLAMVQAYLDNRENSAVGQQYQLSDSTILQLPLSEEDFLDKLLICEALVLEIDGTDEGNKPEVNMTISFGVKDNLTGGHGWDLEIGSKKKLEEKR